MPSQDHIPTEVVEYILSRLPVEAVLRFTCVSKSWSSLIRSDSFIKAHLNRSLADNNNNNYLLRMHARGDDDLCSTLLCGRTLAKLSKLEIPSLKYTMVVGSINGLLCLVNIRDHRKLCLWNPAIRKYKDINGYSCRGATNYLVLGFGYHHKTDDYKIIRSMSYRDNISRLIRVEVYRLSTDSWRKANGVVFPREFSFKQLPALVNEKLHWIAFPFNNFPRKVLSFDVGDEVFQVHKTMLPDYHLLVNHEVGVDCSLHVLRESLALCVRHYVHQFHESSETVDKCYIWVMREYGVVESWSKQYTIVFGEGTRNLCVTRSGQIVSECRLRKLGLYDPENNQIRYIAFDSQPAWLVFLSRACPIPYTKSLILLEAKGTRSADRELPTW